MSTLRLAAIAVGAALAACGPITEEQPAESGAECSFAAADVDPLKELLIVDERVMSDEATKNAIAGALSFRRAIEQIVPADLDPAVTTLAWLDEWAPASLRCDWLRARAENACDATCGTCTERKVDLARAPFRLIAVANRLDLAEEAGEPAEGRLLFGATAGPGDDPRSPSLPITAIFEFRLAGDRREWAARWHALGAPHAIDAAWIRSLAEVANQFVHAEDLGQIRLHDASVTHGVMHEFHLETDRLVRAELRPTPQGTCEGCHGQEHPTTDGTFHVSPHRRGTEKLSRFLLDPDHRNDDELARRAAVMARFACK